LGDDERADHMTLLYHGTGARRKQSISRRGLLPKPDSFVFASRNHLIASIFATARAEQEDDFGMVVVFTKRGTWEIDTQFPNSVKSSMLVETSDIMRYDIINPERELEAYNFLKKVAEILGIRIEGRKDEEKEKQVSVYTENKSK
jgi:hypothetical protein